jgi:hypothetical protein
MESSHPTPNPGAFQQTARRTWDLLTSSGNTPFLPVIKEAVKRRTD